MNYNIFVKVEKNTKKTLKYMTNMLKILIYPTQNYDFISIICLNC